MRLNFFLYTIFIFILSQPALGNSKIPKNHEGLINGETFVFEGSIKNKIISPGSTITSFNKQKSQNVLTVINDQGKKVLLRWDFPNGSTFYWAKKKRFDNLPPVPNTPFEIIFSNGIVAETIYPKSGFSTNYRFFWSTEKKHPFMDGMFDLDLNIIFEPNQLAESLNRSALAKGYKFTHPVYDFVTPKNYKKFSEEKITALYPKGESRHNREAYFKGTYVDKNKFLIFSEKHSIDKKYKNYLRSVIAFRQDKYFRVDLPFKDGDSFIDLSGGSLREVIESNGNTWYGKLDLSTLEKNGWWVRRPNFNADIEQLTLFESNIKVADYSFENGYVDCTWIKNLPNKQKFYSNNEECEGILISKLPSQDRYKNDVEIWGNLVIHEAVRRDDYLISGYLTNLFPFSMFSLTNFAGDYWPAFLSNTIPANEELYNKYNGEYLPDGSLKALIRHELVKQIIFNGFIIDKERNGSALCSIPQTYKGELGPCYWENDKRVDDIYLKEQARVAEINNWFACNDSVKAFSKALWETSNKEFFFPELIIENLEYSWNRDTTAKRLDCDYCYVETQDAVDSAEKSLNAAYRKIDRLNNTLNKEHEFLENNACFIDEKSEINTKFDIAKNSLIEWRNYVDATNEVVKDYSSNVRRLNANKKRNIKAFNQSINREMANHVSTMGNRLNNPAEQKGWDNVNKLAQRLVQESEGNRVKATPVISQAKQTSSQPTVNTPSRTSSKTKESNDKKAFQAACLRGKYNTWENGICITNIPWAGPICYDPSGKHCNTGELISKSKKIAKNEREANELKGTGISGNANSSVDITSTTGEDQKNVKRAMAACWEVTGGWKCNGPLQKLYIAEGTLEVALSRVACEPSNAIQTRSGKGEWAGSEIYLYDCGRGLKVDDIDVMNLGMF